MLGAGALTDVRHLPVSAGFNDVQVRFEGGDPQQPVVMGRLLGRRDAEPFVVGVKNTHVVIPFWRRPLQRTQGSTRSRCKGGIDTFTNLM